MESPLDEYTPLLRDLLDTAERAGAYLIARIQRVESRSLNVVNGKTESMSASLGQGIGLQVFDRAGHTAFASTDRVAPEAASQALRSALAGLQASAAANLERNDAIFALDPVRESVSGPAPYSLEHLSLDRVEEYVLAINHEVQALGPDLKVRTPFGLNREFWRIVRSDGTDVDYMLPHGYCSNSVTVQRDGEAHTVNASLARTGYEILLDDTHRSTLLARAANAAQVAQQLVGAPRYAAGSYPIVMDYAMAKGLAHEAFGHAAETDGMRTSILGAGGLFRRGELMASEIVSIVDESLPGDHAFQPFSPNGVRRDRATILDHGVLTDALADVFSARDAGVRVIDAARAQSYGNVPVPRMTNIRIELPEPMPLAGRFEDQHPEHVRAALLNAGYITPDHAVIFLAGYKGGQVNPAQGDFVFNCAALYELSSQGIRLFQPGIFAGRAEAALHAIRAGFGPLQLDAMGYCGKAGQSVPSSGGSHYFLYLEAHPQVTIGGRS